MLATLDAKIASIANETAAMKLNQQEHEKILQANLKEVQEKQKEKSSFGGMLGRRTVNPAMISKEESMQMDVDDPSETSKGKNRKSVHPHTAPPTRL